MRQKRTRPALSQHGVTEKSIISPPPFPCLCSSFDGEKEGGAEWRNWAINLQFFSLFSFPGGGGGGRKGQRREGYLFPPSLILTAVLSLFLFLFPLFGVTGGFFVLCIYVVRSSFSYVWSDFLPSCSFLAKALVCSREQRFLSDSWDTYYMRMQGLRMVGGIFLFSSPVPL